MPPPSTTAPGRRRPPAVVPRPRRRGLRPGDWLVRTKLGLVLAVPTIAFVVVAGVQTSGSVRQAEAWTDLAGQVALGQEITALVHELQFARDRTAGELAAVAALPAGARPGADLPAATAAARERVAEARTDYDRAVAPLREQPGLRGPIATAAASLDELATVHDGIAQGWLRQGAVFDGYTRAIDDLLALLPAPATGDGPGAGAHRDLAAVKELAAQVRGQVFALTSGGRAEPAAVARLADVRAQRTAAQERFRASASPAELAHFDEVVRGQAARSGARLAQSMVDQASAGQLAVDPEQWWTAATAELDLIREVEALLLAEAHTAVAGAGQRQWRQTALVTAASLCILLLSLLLSFGIGRSLVRSLRRLRDQAIDVAHVQLPGFLTRLRAARDPAPMAAEVAPVAVNGADEVADLADAFAQVHHSAVQLAVDQAVMRRNVNSIFVNLARRSQVLVERQLELLDDLELEETEPTQLSNLFRLDHLATRMRRNNESLLVLAGTEAARPFHRPVPLAAVALAAIAEIEQYQRVRDQVSPALHVVGRAVSDLVHLLAELLDNATTFSARQTTVVLTGQRLPEPAGALVEISDSGLGMSPAALSAANTLLAAPPAIDVAASERMGLVVVGHLAARHNIRVTLATTPHGIRASVRLPAGLLTTPSEDAYPLPLRVPALVPAGVEPAGRAALRAEDVLAGTASDPEPASTWWSPPPVPALAVDSADPPDPNSLADPAEPAPLAEPAAAAAPESARPTNGQPVGPPRTSPAGLPIRVPLAQLPGGGGAGVRGPGAAVSVTGAPGPRRAGGWQAADPDPDTVGSTLSRFYRGVRQAETEAEPGPIDPRSEPPPETGGPPHETGGADGESEPGRS